ncbi:sigma-54 interaction domain-containing protein [Oligosphaera ethanolica]|uniref:PAS domain S-box-containing protein n=1 Tax=Oligosphaera ethanolica TaxID=760260 RepID=A0AAE4ARN1_9BACT|nr:sigma 54-interacting transcriptional regulator [Oligosphaera ethanolica]MDQ0291672.1 PAS domain S-box-containing protein [Oligosphaera ethanolica]
MSAEKAKRTKGAVAAAAPSRDDARSAMADRAILESISDGVFTVDRDFRITYLNRSAEDIIQVRREDAMGRMCCEVFRSNLCEGACALRQTLEQGRPIIDLSCFIVNNAGQRVPVSISTAVLRDASGTVIGGAETFRNLSDIEQLREEISATRKIGDFGSHSPSMRTIFSQLTAIAETCSTVLIRGETGSGKELLARTIHANGPRRDGPFVAINCGAFPETLLESELFGYKKGAFTGADRDKPGRFALAEGGTLLLDEIGEISPAMQVRLLRVLQERSYEPLGAVKSVRSNARIIAATHRRLEDLVASGAFRQDLFYRINVVQLALPPLRERREDIPFLVEQFIRRFNLVMKRQVAGVSRSALRMLSDCPWPGNIRQLENCIERSMVFCRGNMIEVDDLPDEVRTSGNAVGSPALPAASMQEAVSLSERQAIQAALAQCGGNRRLAAEKLGLHPTTFYRKLKRLGLRVDLPDGRHKRD